MVCWVLERNESKGSYLLSRSDIEQLLGKFSVFSYKYCYCFRCECRWNYLYQESNA